MLQRKDYVMNMLGSIPHQKLRFIIYLLEDEQELSLGMLICLQRIYNFWLLHAILFTVLNVYGLYYTLLYHFGTNLLTQSPVPVSVFTLF